MQRVSARTSIRSRKFKDRDTLRKILSQLQDGDLFYTQKQIQDTFSKL